MASCLAAGAVPGGAVCGVCVVCVGGAGDAAGDEGGDGVVFCVSGSG